ncbi:uncharacterized protein LOC132700431 [Cylas formicarius]|uniref:uncharacterized protein LOC132700431 n=1 Tax=Cylas formicarius TaxID=197179 RepID=UPI0029583532|nr:uncharacterized protein LOC132700431 [Cylas formicarius]
MIICGVWRLEMKSLSRFQKILYSIHSVIIQTINMIIPILLTANLPVLFKEDISGAFQALSMILFCILANLKGIMCQSKCFLKLQKIVLEHETILLEGKDEDVHKIYTTHVHYSKKLSKFFLLAGALAASVLFEMGCLDSYKVHKMQKHTNVSLEKPLPLKLWYPWDKNKYHIFLMLSQFVEIAVSAFYVAVAQIFTTTLLTFLRAKLKILQHQFRNFGLHLNHFDEVETIQKLCFKHQTLIQIIKSVNDVMRNIIFFEFSMSSVMFAAGIFQVIAKQDLLFNIEFSVSMISFLMLLAWNANEIRTESSQLAMALYESRWYEQTHQTKVIMQFMLMRCQKPLSINIGPLGPITVDAAMSFTKKTMIICGIWRLKIKSWSTFQNILYFIYSVIFQITNMMIPTLLAANLPVLFKTDVSGAFQAISMILFGTMANMKGIMCQSKDFLKLQTMFMEDEAMLLSGNDQEANKIYTKHIIYSKKLSKFFLLAGGLAASFLIETGCENSYKVHKLGKRVNVSLESPLPLKLWYPWDKNRYHILTLMSQLLDIAVTAFYVAVVQIFTTTILIFLRAKLKIMEHQFRNFGTSYINRDIMTNGVDTVRRLCVKHQRLIELINSVNEVLRSIIFFEFSMSSLMFASGILQILARQDLLFNIEFSISMISFLMLLAWNANQIRTESSKLATALYESRWYEQTPQTKIIMQFMLMRCQRPLSINIGPFGPITLDAAISAISMILFGTMANMKGIMCQSTYFLRLQRIFMEDEAMILSGNDQKANEIYTTHAKYTTFNFFFNSGRLGGIVSN